MVKIQGSDDLTMYSKMNPRDIYID